MFEVWPRLDWKDYVLIALSTTALTLGDYLYFLMLPLLLLGMILNAWVCYSNNRLMPVKIPEQKFMRHLTVWEVEKSPGHCLMNTETRMPLLGDIIWFGHRCLSIGDLLIIASSMLKWTYGPFLIIRWIYSFFA